MTMTFSLGEMTPKELTAYEIARVKDVAFDAVHSLWRRRQKDGMSQADLAQAIGRDEAWVSRTLSGPGNWTLLTFGRLVGGLRGEAEIHVAALEDPLPDRSNYDAYIELMHFSNEHAATDNVDVKRTWDRSYWKPDVVLEGSDDQGRVLLEIKRC